MKTNKNKILKKIDKAEKLYSKGVSQISQLTTLIQPYFEEEIIVCPSPDGALITTTNGEIGFVSDFIKNLEE